MGIADDERFDALLSKSGVSLDEARGVSLDVGLVNTLKRASFLVKCLIRSEGDAFELCVVDDLGNARLRSNGPGKMLRKLVKLNIPLDNKFSEIYKLDPYIELAINRIVRAGLYQTYLSQGRAAQYHDAEVLLPLLNGCVDQIRQEGTGKEFQSKLNNYQRSSNKNYQELTEYVEALFERYSRLLVLRLDLGYQKQYSKTTQVEAKRDRERLFENARSNKLFGDVVGYIWKLEHGPDKGFHYHVMLFFDGSKVREDITLACLIGKYWVDVVTKGRGLYFNCNASKWRYRKCGVGMISHADNLLREGLRNAVVYLTKTDLYMKLQTVGRGMGKGNRPLPKGSRGRPRATANGAEPLMSNE